MRNFALIFISLLLLVPGCGQEKKQEEKPVISQEQKEFVAIQNNFTFTMLSRIYDQDFYSNASISGTSAYTALCMLANGAKSPCLDEMMTSMGLEGQDISSVNQNVSKFLHKKYGDDISIVSSNSIWMGKDAMVVEDFANTMKTQYLSSAEKIDFTDEKSAQTINSWVSKSTNGKIKELVKYDEIKDMLLMLINAIYLKAPWTDTFDPQATSDMDFTNIVGQKKKVKMMTKTAFYKFHKSDGFSIARLPYGKNEELAFYIILPEAADGLISLSKFFDKKYFDLELAKIQDTELMLQLPKMKIEYEADLIPTLKGMGMSAVFDPTISDLSGMVANPQNAYVSMIKHKTYINIDEGGTEAAAVTGIGMVGSAAPDEKKPKEFVVDHPFMCIIRDESTGEVIFSAFVANL